MKPVASWMEWAFVGMGYAGVSAIAVALLYRRHLLELQDPATASGGMFAAGDTMLHIFIGGLFLVPTVLLIRILARSEALYSAYSRFLLGLSLSAPICFAVELFGEKYVPQSLSWLCFFRMEESPIVFLGIGISRIAARFDRAKKLISYALLVEGLTWGLPIAAFVIAIFIRR